MSYIEIKFMSVQHRSQAGHEPEAEQNQKNTQPWKKGF